VKIAVLWKSELVILSTKNVLNNNVNLIKLSLKMHNVQNVLNILVLMIKKKNVFKTLAMVDKSSQMMVNVKIVQQDLELTMIKQNVNHQNVIRRRMKCSSTTEPVLKYQRKRIPQK